MRPAPSRWGGAPPTPDYVPSAESKILAAGRAKGRHQSLLADAPDQTNGSSAIRSVIPGTRSERERDKSPMVPAYDELSERLRKAGLKPVAQPRPSPSPLLQAIPFTSRPISPPPTPCAPPVTPSSETPLIDLTCCGGCNLDLGYGDLVESSTTGRTYHPSCFTCSYCAAVFTDGKYVVSENNQAAHLRCIPMVIQQPKIVSSIRESKPQGEQEYGSQSNMGKSIESTFVRVGLLCLAMASP